MAYADKILPSIYGRRLGLQSMSTNETGGSRGTVEFLVGPEGLRDGVTTGESTGTNLKAWGASRVFGTSAASTPVYTIDPPIPGVSKSIYFASTDSALYVKGASGVSFAGTSFGATGATAIRSAGGGFVHLIGLTTALYGAVNVSSTAVNGVAFQATT